MKFLKSTLREKKRYLEVRLTESVSASDFEEEFRKAFGELLGEKGFAEANPLLIRNLWRDNIGVLRVNHEHVTSAKVALTLIRQIKGKQLLVITGKVYGTLKKHKRED